MTSPSQQFPSTIAQNAEDDAAHDPNLAHRDESLPALINTPGDTPSPPAPVVTVAATMTCPESAQPPAQWDLVEQSAPIINKQLPVEGVPSHHDVSFGPAELALPRPHPLSRPGRPTVLSDQIKDQLYLLLSVGLSRRQAAAYIAVDPSTISRAAGRDPEFAYCLRRAEELSALHPTLTLIAESRKNWRAAAWLMEYRRQHPAPLSAEEKAERDQQRLADARRQLDYDRELRILHEEARAAEDQRRLARELGFRRAAVDAETHRRQRPGQ